MAMSAPAAAGGIVLPLPPPPSVSRARLSTSLEPTGLAGTSWNSIRWARPTGGTGYRTSRLANAFETSGTSTCSSSAASTCSAVPPRAQSPFAYAKLRSSDRAASTSRPHNDGTVIRANSRYGTSLLNSGSPTTSSARAASHSVSSGGAFKSSRQTTAAAAAAAEPLRRTIVAYRPLSYSGGGISQPRATLMDIRQNLRPVKRHTVTDHSTTPSSRTSSSASTLLSNVRAAFASTSAMAPAVLSNVSPTSTNKCVTSPSMSRSSSSVTSPVTTLTPRPIPKSERPWRQKLADAQRMRDAQEGRSAHRLPTEPYDSTMRLLAAAKSTRRTSVEQQQLDAEQKLAQQIAALKCYVSEPGALDKSATVAKFRQRMAEGQAPASLRSISSPSGGDGTSAVAAATSNTSAAVPSSSGSTTASSSSAAALLARMPSLNRRATTAVTHDLLRSMEKQQQQAAVGRKKERPMSLVETALGNGGSRRLSVVKEGSVSGDTPRPGSTDEQTLSPPPETPRLPAAADGQSVNGNGKTPTALKSAKESPKLAKKRKTTTTTGGADSATQQQQQQQPTSASSSATTQNNSDGTVAKRKASPKTSGGVDGGTKEARPETTTTAPPKKQQLTLVKRLLTNNNGSSSNNNNNKTTLPTTPTQPSKPPKKAPQAKEEEEGNYNAVVQFRPQSMLQRKLCGVAKKSSASLSTLAETSDEPRPVPGTWQRSMKDRCISHNKHLIRRAASESTLHVHRAVPVLRVSSTRMLTPGRVANKCEGAFVNRLCQTHNAAISVRGAKGQSPTATVLKMIKSIARPRQQRVCAVAVLDKALSNKRRLRLGIQKTLVQKSAPKKMCAQLRCKSAKLATTAVRLNIVWKEQKKQVAVTILLADVPEVNWCRVASGLIWEQNQQQQQQQQQKSMSPLKRLQQLALAVDTAVAAKPKMAAAQKQQQQQQSKRITLGSTAAVAVAAPTSAASSVSAQKPGGDGTRATAKQQQQSARAQPATEPAQTLQATFGGGGVQQQQLILPDQSLLEQYVQHKRDALEQLRAAAECAGAGGDRQKQRVAHGPATPAAALFVPTVPVLLLSASLPGSKRNSQMLATATAPSGAELPQSLTSSFHSAIEATAADLRAAAAKNVQPRMRRAAARQQQQPMPVLSTQAFEKPKSLFEEQMQRQAIELRQRAVRQSLHEPNAAAPAVEQQQPPPPSSAAQQQQQQQAQAVPAPQRRRSGAAAAAATEHAVVAQPFVAQAQKPHQQEQRYAAHIPLSGRQSTTSVESGNSGAQLDTATRRLDQMIDQARYRHNQHRNKFKEAIDYLDHIFEDFQREAADSRPAKKAEAQQKAQQQQHQQKQESQAVQQQRQPQQQQQQQDATGSIEPVQATFRQGSVKSAKEAFEKVAAAIASEKTSNSRLRKQPSAPSSSQRPAKVALRSVLPSSYSTTALASVGATTATANAAAGAVVEMADVDVAETIVLPTKNSADRLDFTKHWLQGGEVSVWAQGAPPRRDDALLGTRGTEAFAAGYESDEHSLGSCSAEVAAINAADEQRRRRQHQPQQQQPKKKTAAAAPAVPSHQQQQATTAVAPVPSAVTAPQRHKQHQQQQSTVAEPPLPQIIATVIAVPSSATSRPQPFRPQPQLGVLPPALAAAAASTSGEQMLHKVPSIEQLRLMRSSQERAGSQDYQSMGSSVHSQDGFRPAASCLSTHSLQRIGLSGGAFHSYTPTTSQQHQQQHHHHQQQQQQQSGQYQQQQQLKGSIQSLPDSALSAGRPTVSAYSQPFTLQPNRQFATLARMDSQHHHPQQHQLSSTNFRPSVQQQQQVQQAQQHQRVPTTAAATTTATLNDHVMAIDALVAELELNTTDTATAAAEKRRSFPTMQTEVSARTKAKIVGTGQQQQQQPLNMTNRSALHHQLESSSTTNSCCKPLEKLNELMSLEGTKQKRKQPPPAAQPVHGMPSSSATTTSTTASGNRAFETINQEKLNPSKVDAMARMFNKHSTNLTATTTTTAAPKTFTSGGGCAQQQQQQQQSWTTRRAATIGGRAAVPSSSSSFARDQQQQQQQLACAASHMTTGPSRSYQQLHQNGGGGDMPLLTNGHSNTTAQHAPLKKQHTLPATAASSTASCTMAPLSSSSRIYRSAGSRGGGGTAATRLDDMRRTEPAAAAAVGVEQRRDTPTVVDEEGGAGLDEGGGNNFYDNVQNIRSRRRTSPGYSNSNNDSISLCSQQDAALPPPSAGSKGSTGGGAGGRIGQLIRKLGNSVGNGKVPTSAASMLSLNRVSNDPSGGAAEKGGGMTATTAVGGGSDGTLTKSTSLSGEPWRYQVLAQQPQQNGRKTDGGQSNNKQPQQQQQQNGIGNRLKQTIFGSAIRRRVPT